MYTVGQKPLCKLRVNLHPVYLALAENNISALCSLKFYFLRDMIANQLREPVIKMMSIITK